MSLLRSVSGKKQKLLLGIAGLMVAAGFFLQNPDPLFSAPQSWVLLDRKGELLGAKIAADGQWRFPESDKVPSKFKTCLIAFEDKRFENHWGVDVVALGRAVQQNWRGQRKVSGASTITMQVIRLSRGPKARTYPEKLVEIWLALRLELGRTKGEILSYYASHAPFGGNIVGLEAASWRYYRKPASQISWGEAAALAVLPNSPSLVRPGRNAHLLQRKRDRLLDKLYRQGALNKETCRLAKLEPLPAVPYPLPELAPHLLERICASETASGNGRLVRSTIQSTLQQRVSGLAARHAQSNQSNGIHNLAVLVLDTRSGEVLTYTGNAPQFSREANAASVDNVTAARSTGSILKPLLYCSMLQDGSVLPWQLVPDIPTHINSFHPQNYNREHAGAVPASQALARSLNVPAVHLLRDYTPSQFLAGLKRMGLTTLTQAADHYGLSLILGGAEASLWDLAGVYSSMGRALLQYNKRGKYAKGAVHPPVFEFSETEPDKAVSTSQAVFSAGSVYLTFEAMLRVSRPDEEQYWTNFQSGQQVAWKTGTSFGSRDAWAIGCTPKYVVAVWVGNSSGEGRTGLTGLGYAAPLLFDVFNSLSPQREWFRQPLADLKPVTCCRESGFLAGNICPETMEVLVPKSARPSTSCPFHQLAHLNAAGTYQLSTECSSTSEMRHVPWFVLPPRQEHHYRQTHPDYRPLPPFKEGCQPAAAASSATGMELIYPPSPTQLYLPLRADGTPGPLIFEATHRNRSSLIHWHLDKQYLRTTTNGLHQLSFQPEPGRHQIMLIDETGAEIEMPFTVVDRKSRAIASG